MKIASAARSIVLILDPKKGIVSESARLASFHIASVGAEGTNISNYPPYRHTGAMSLHQRSGSGKADSARVDDGFDDPITVRIRSRMGESSVNVRDGPETVQTQRREESVRDLLLNSRVDGRGTVQMKHTPKDAPQLTREEKAARDTFAQVVDYEEKLKKRYTERMAPVKQRLKEDERALLDKMENKGIRCIKLRRRVGSSRGGLEEDGGASTDGEGDDSFELFLLREDTYTQPKPLLNRQGMLLKAIAATDPKNGAIDVNSANSAVASSGSATAGKVETPPEERVAKEVLAKQGERVLEATMNQFRKMKQEHDAGIERARKQKLEEEEKAKRRRERSGAGAQSQKRTRAEQNAWNQRCYERILHKQSSEATAKILE